MALLVVATAIVTLICIVLLVHRYRTFVSYAIIAHIAVFYLYLGKVTIKPAGVNIYTWDLVFLLVLFDLTVRLFRDYEPLDRSTWLLVAALLSYVSWFEFSEIVNIYIVGGDFKNIIRNSISSFYPIIGLAVALSFSKKNFDKFVTYFVFTGIAVSLMLLIQELFNIGGFVTNTGTIRRGSGNMAVLLQTVLAVLLFARYWPAWFRYTAALLVIVGIVIIQHRSAYLGAGLLLSVYFIFLLKHRANTSRAIFLTPLSAIALTVVVAVVSFSSNPAVESFRTRLVSIGDTQDVTSVDRLLRWNIAMKSVAENPIGGTKLNGLPDFYGAHVTEAKYALFDIAKAHGAYIYQSGIGATETYGPHNIFVNILSRNGYVGLILFLMIVLGAHIALKQKSPRTRYCVFGAISANLLFLAFNMHYSYDAMTTLSISMISFPLRLQLEEGNMKSNYS